MNNRAIWVFLILCVCWLPPLSAQSAGIAPDPMKGLSKTFPDAVAIKNKGRLFGVLPGWNV